MMHLGDSFMLAYTKLKTRKIRLFFALLTSSLLFSLLVAGSLVVTGTLNSIDSFSKEGFSDRYIIAGTYQNFENYDKPLADPQLVARAEQLEKDEIAAKKAAAKKLNIEFDEAAALANKTAVVPPNEFNKEKLLDLSSKFALQALAERGEADPNKLTLDKFKAQVGAANHFYRGATRANLRTDAPELTLVTDGVERKADTSTPYGMGYGTSSNGKGLKTMPGDWSLLDQQLLQPFVLKGQNLEVGSDGSLPIVTTYSAAQEVLKLAKLPNDASAKDKKTRLEQVRRDIAGKTFQVCYRNASANAEYQSAVQQQAQITLESGKKDYVKPSLIRAPAKTPCSAPVVTSDARGKWEKDYAARQEQFDRQFGKAEPVTSMLTFRIVGVTQDAPFTDTASAGDATGIISSIVASSLGARWVSPLSAEPASAPVQDVFKRVPITLMSSQEGYFAEYADADTARTVLKTKTCRQSYNGMTPDMDTSLPICSAERTSFMLGTYGSASLAIDDFKQGFRKVQLWAALIVAIIASAILIGMIGRIISDARKETAVFRATGATRLMIAQIYLVYTLYLVALMILISLALGFGAALVVNAYYSADASINMSLLFNVADLSKQFVFYGLEPYDLGIISATVLAAALIGASVPIAANIQRNPIRDMRDE